MKTRYKAFFLGDADFLEKEIKSVGFSTVKTFYAPMHPVIRNVLDYKNLLFNLGLNYLYNQFDEETKIKFDSDLEKEFDENFGPKTSKVLEFEILVAIAFK